MLSSVTANEILVDLLVVVRGEGGLYAVTGIFFFLTHFFCVHGTHLSFRVMTEKHLAGFCCSDGTFLHLYSPHSSWSIWLITPEHKKRQDERLVSFILPVSVSDINAEVRLSFNVDTEFGRADRSHGGCG